MSKKLTAPQTAALLRGAETGYIVKDTPNTGGNVWRTALVLVTAGLATQVDEANVTINEAGFEAAVAAGFTGERPAILQDTQEQEQEQDTPAEGPSREDVQEAIGKLQEELSSPEMVAAIAEGLTGEDTPEQQEEAPTPSAVLTEPDGPVHGDEGKILQAEAGLRVHHTHPLRAGCKNPGHRHGVMTGRAELRGPSGRKKVVRAEVKMDCGHTRWPLQRVLIVTPVEGQETGDQQAVA